MVNLLGALILLGGRALRPADRRQLGPLLIGTAIGVGPLAIFVALPRFLGFAGAALDRAGDSIPTAAIPISFAYSILRTRCSGSTR